MSPKTLTIIESAYRATLEEQDDTIVWITHAMKGAGGDFTVLLRSNAVNYAVKGQDAAGLDIGGWKQTQPPRVGQDLVALAAKGVSIYAVEEDLAARGIERSELLSEVKLTSLAGVAKLFQDHERVWHW